MSEDQKRVLERQLWAAANVLRGTVSADDYRDYILGFIFFKYLSERQEILAEELLAQEPDSPPYNQFDPENPEHLLFIKAMEKESIAKLGFQLLPQHLFSTILAKGRIELSDEERKTAEEAGTLAHNFILNDLKAAFRHIERSTRGEGSEEDFDQLFEDIVLDSTKIGRTPTDRNKVIVQVMKALAEIDFRLKDIDADVIGDAYEYLIGRFAQDSARSAGEFYTPSSISKLLASLALQGKTIARNVYDPTCGSGSLLLQVGKHLNNPPQFKGQEKTRTTYNLARMNMILHGIHYNRFEIKNDDTLTRPMHIEERFEVIVANPPFSINWCQEEHELISANDDDRFRQFGRLAPKSKADFAFLQHMYFQLADNGTLASIFPHGVLFRGAAEATIRRHFIEKLNALDAVIGLPENLFTSTSIPTCILVLSKCRKDTDHVMFIDASGEDNYEKEGTKNTMRPHHIERILDTYLQRKTIDKFSRLVPLSEIAENDYNLNIPRYVDTFEDEEPIDINAVALALQDNARAIQAAQKGVAAFCQELGITPPFPSEPIQPTPSTGSYFSSHPRDYRTKHKEAVESAAA